MWGISNSCNRQGWRLSCLYRISHLDNEKAFAEGYEIR